MDATFEDRVLQTMRCHDMAAPGAHVLVAVSGGADSMALLHVLMALGLRVEIAHLDHQTRGGESRADADFVQAMASELGLPYHTESRAVTQGARERGESFEAYARKERYAFLCRVAREQDCYAVATGHHRDDQAETVLMRLLRGAGPTALAGIPPVRMEQGVRIIRPMLECSRDEIRDWLRSRGIAWREDASNEDTQFLRNRIRHELIPSLREAYNPQLSAVLCRSAEALRQDASFLDFLAEDAFADCFVPPAQINRDHFRALHESLQRRCMLLLARRFGVELSHGSVIDGAAAVRDGDTGSRFPFGAEHLLHNSRTHTEVVSTDQRDSATAETTTLQVPGTTEAMGHVFSCRMLGHLPEEDLAAYCTPQRQVFDADAIGDPIVVRGRRDGDRFAPLGLGGSKKLQDYFVDVGLPAPHRDTHPLVMAGERIIWVVGHAMDAKAAVSRDTKRILEIEVADVPKEGSE